MQDVHVGKDDKGKAKAQGAAKAVKKGVYKKEKKVLSPFLMCVWSEQLCIAQVLHWLPVGG